MVDNEVSITELARRLGGRRQLGRLARLHSFKGQADWGDFKGHIVARQLRRNNRKRSQSTTPRINDNPAAEW
jgi:hypothetical protein